MSRNITPYMFNQYKDCNNEVNVQLIQDIACHSHIEAKEGDKSEEKVEAIGDFCKYVKDKLLNTLLITLQILYRIRKDDMTKNTLPSSTHTDYTLRQWRLEAGILIETCRMEFFKNCGTEDQWCQFLEKARQIDPAIV